MTRTKARSGGSTPPWHRSCAAWLGDAVAPYAWALIRPTAWGARLTLIDPGLRSDFCFFDLLSRHTNANRRRLLVQIHTAAMILMAGAAASVVLAAGARTAVVTSLAFGVLLGYTGTLTTSAILGVGGAPGGIFIAAAFGLACGVAAETLGSANALAEALTRLDTTARVAGGLPLSLPPNPIAGIAISIAVGIAGYTAAVPRAGAGPSLARQVGATGIGVVTCLATHGGAVLLTLAATQFTTRREAASAACAAMIGVASAATARLRGSSRRDAMTSGSFMAAIMAVAIYLCGRPELEANTAVILSGAPTAIFYSVLFALAFVLAERLGGRWAGAAASAIGSGTVYVVFLVVYADLEWHIVPLSVLGNLIGLMLPWWLPVVLYPFEAAASLWLLNAEARRTASQRSLIDRHPARWDEIQWLPLPGLDEQLLLVCERNPVHVDDLLASFSTTRQRWAARAARIELDARALERCRTVEAIGGIGEYLHTDAASSAASILSRFVSISRNASVAMKHGSLFDRRFHLLAVEDQLRELMADLTRGEEPSERFLPIVIAWRTVIRAHQTTLGEILEQRQEIYNPYVRGMPLDEHQETFVGRGAVSAQIAEILSNRYPPALLVHGQRRMGKTSLLNRLGRLLPTTIVPMFVDLQGAATKAVNVAGFLGTVSRTMCASAMHHRRLSIVPPATSALERDPFTVFDHWLSQLELDLGDATAVIAFDEFEALDAALRAGRFAADDVLGLLRHVIQHRRRITVLLSGSHTLDEVGYWSAYLINLQTVHLSYLTEEEARQLVERPVRDFPLCYQPEAGSRVIELTRCHPLLTQLLCHHIVALKNSHPFDRRRVATIADVESAVPDALVSGTLAFQDMANQAGRDGVAILRRLATEGERRVVDLATLSSVVSNTGRTEEALSRLLKRELVEAVPGGYRFQVELVRRWFAEQSVLKFLK